MREKNRCNKKVILFLAAVCAISFLAIFACMREPHNSAHLFVQMNGDTNADIVSEYTLLADAKEYDSYIEVYRSGKLVEQKVLSHCEITDEMRKMQYKISVQYIDTPDAYGEVDGMVDAVCVSDTFGDQEQQVCIPFLTPCGMRAQDILWMDGGKQTINLNQDYITFAAYIGDQDTKRLNGYMCQQLMDEETIFRDCINQSCTTLLIHFKISD